MRILLDPETPVAAAAVTAKVAPPVISPVAEYFEGLRDEVEAEIAAWNPKGACPVHLPIAKDTAKAMIDALTPDARGAIVRIEVAGASGKQIMVQVTPTLIKI